MGEGTSNINQLAYSRTPIPHWYLLEHLELVRFPHYKPLEIELAKRFIRSGQLKGAWQFSVLLETPDSRRIREIYAGKYARQAELSMLEIDAVVEVEDAIYLVEFFERFDDKALGHLITYRRLYLEQFHPTLPVRLMVVAVVDNPAVRDTYDSEGVEWRIA